MTAPRRILRPKPEPAAACHHGGASFEAVGDQFDDIGRRHTVINADVLDAWFPPAPGVIAAMQDSLEWTMRTSPPTHSEGLRAVLAAARGVGAEQILTGAGSSDLIFRAMQAWLTPRSRALILDPCYGEYAHVLEGVVGCQVDRFTLRRADTWAPDLARLGTQLERGKYDLFVLVNPNNPTGHHIPRSQVVELLSRVPASTTVWIEEAYLEYVAPDESLESIAADSHNVFVCKSLSKVYALSGVRAAYLVGRADEIGRLRVLTPPWIVGLPAQVAAVRALQDIPYYARRWRETSALRNRLTGMLRRIPGVEEVTGAANFVLVHLAPDVPAASAVLAACRADLVYLRDPTAMSRQLGARVFRSKPASR
jgi:histidinol-phosphate/aromatic aminotransferase/cobyric acid decarboxylase-like protein